MTSDSYECGLIQWQAWAQRHNSHGPVLTDMIWLPKGDEPETSHDWIRVEIFDFTQTQPFTEGK